MALTPTTTGGHAAERVSAGPIGFPETGGRPPARSWPGYARASTARLTYAAGEVTWAIVIPGSGRMEPDGGYRIGPRALACVRAAASLAERRTPRAVVLTGWSPVLGPSEAEQMRDAWDGPGDVELVVEPTASITAENMSRSLPHLLERGVGEVTVVCGWMHLARVRYHFGGVYPGLGIRCSYALARQLPTPGVLAWEAGGMFVMRRQRRAALAEIEAAMTAAPPASRTAVPPRVGR
jgi:DUF218 domain